MNKNNFFNRKSLKSVRQALRNLSTSAEAALWNLINTGKIEGRKVSYSFVFRESEFVVEEIRKIFFKDTGSISFESTTPAR